MTLAEIADFVCTKVRLLDPESVAICKTFIRQRHEMIWDMALWRDTVYQLNFTIDTTLDDPIPPNIPAAWLKGIHYLPTVVDRMLALRTTDQPLYPEHEENFYRVDLDQYEEEGTPVKFLVMARACAHTMVAFPANSWTIDWQQSTDNGTEIGLDYIDHLHDVHSVVAVPPITGGSGYDIVQIDRLTKPVTDGWLRITIPEQMNDMQVLANETELARRLRVKIVPNPVDGSVTIYKALVKRKIIPMGRDYDTASIRNMDNVLIAFAQGDMLQYDRQYGKAKDCTAEGIGLLEKLKSSAAVQESSVQRLIPEPEGYPTSETPGKSIW